MPATKNEVHNIQPEKIVKSLFKQKVEGNFCDVKLCLGDAVVWGHACVLAPLSSYIMELFKANSDTNHWCPQKPLMIDLDIGITEGQDKCVLCLSALVDFMYSQDLVLLEGHIQHLGKMISYLKIVDLFPVFNTDGYEKNTLSLNKELDVQEFYEDPLYDTKGFIKTVQNDKSAKLKPINPKRLSNNSETTNSYHEQSIKKTKLNTSDELNQIWDSPVSVLPCSESIDGIVEEEHNYVTNLKQKCEFLCCTGEVVSSCSSINRRRKITCEMCSFTGVSIKNVLKHIESMSHLGTMCPICTQKFQSTSSLKEHLNDHNHSKPYLCQFCSKRTRFWEFYKMHLKVHCRNKQFYCEICLRSFKSQQSLKVHLKSHKTNYLCSSCDHLASDADAFKVHLLIHKENAHSLTLDALNSYDNFRSISDSDLIKHKTGIRFLCEFCKEGFTQKSNLKRHIELKHSNVPNFHCCKCTYATKRTDLLKSHMKKHHNCLPEEIKRPSQKTTKRVSKKQKVDKEQSKVVGVLIPVQLVSTNDLSTLNAFAVKTSVSGESENVLEENPRKKFKKDVGLHENNSSTTNINSTSVLNTHPSSNNLVDNTFSFAENCDSNMNGSLETLNSLPGLADSRSMKNKPDLILKNNEIHCQNDFRGKVQNIESNVATLELSLNADNPPSKGNTNLSQPVLNISQEFNDLQIDLEEGETNLNSIQVEADLLTRSGDYWLNEATGELLNENSIVNMQMIDPSCRFSSSAENPHEDTIDPLHTLILSDTSKTVSILDFRDDVDELKSNPQTPQTNLVEVDDPDNLFPWSCIDSNFCSTWVLNEATGELNMVSFNVQPIKHSDESKLDENTGMFSPKDDDETALFLNEGTGDLSVIYFNPSNREFDGLKQLNGEQGIQDVPDNVSEHSNDEEDFLNAEFFEATASFMAHKENETFLNELTGEFDTNISDFPELRDNQISGSESYLNEETGEILWNVLNKNVGSDFFTNSESFKYDPDDSLNCDDFEPFANEMNDFSSQFCLETAQDWQSVDETCDILLNECTGELVKKS